VIGEATAANGASVEYDVSATDISDGAVAVTCTPASGSTFALGSTLVNCTSTDADNNSSSASFTVTVRDTTAPVLTVNNVAVIATSAAGAVAAYSTSASDLVDGSVAVSCSHASGAMYAPGTTTVNCTATDAAGNTGSASFTVTVSFAWSNLLQPVNTDGSSVFKQGRVVPVKFALAGASAGITNLSARIFVARVSNGVMGEVNEAGLSVTADAGNLFRYSNGEYIFNLSTSNMSEGTWAIRVDLGDGFLHDTLVGMRR
jgi:hypothetical protein